MVIRAKAARKGRRRLAPRVSGFLIVRVRRLVRFSDAAAVAGFFFLASGAGAAGAGSAVPEAAVFILSSMHLLTRSARLSISRLALPFSVFIQHSEAARECVIGGSGGLAASGAGPLPVVSQPASSAAAAAISAKARRRATTVRGSCFNTVMVSRSKNHLPPGQSTRRATPCAPAICPKQQGLRNALVGVTRRRARRRGKTLTHPPQPAGDEGFRLVARGE